MKICGWIVIIFYTLNVYSDELISFSSEVFLSVDNIYQFGQTVNECYVKPDEMITTQESVFQDSLYRRFFINKKFQPVLKTYFCFQRKLSLVTKSICQAKRNVYNHPQRYESIFLHQLTDFHVEYQNWLRDQTEFLQITAHSTSHVFIRQSFLMYASIFKSMSKANYCETEDTNLPLLYLSRTRGV